MKKNFAICVRTKLHRFIQLPDLLVQHLEQPE